MVHTKLTKFNLDFINIHNWNNIRFSYNKVCFSAKTGFGQIKNRAIYAETDDDQTKVYTWETTMRSEFCILLIPHLVNHWQKQYTDKTGLCKQN